MCNRSDAWKRSNISRSWFTDKKLSAKIYKELKAQEYFDKKFCWRCTYKAHAAVYPGTEKKLKNCRTISYKYWWLFKVVILCAFLLRVLFVKCLLFLLKFKNYFTTWMRYNFDIFVHLRSTNASMTSDRHSQSNFAQGQTDRTLSLCKSILHHCTR